jgi:hypothetical protein
LNNIFSQQNGLVDLANQEQFDSLLETINKYYGVKHIRDVPPNKILERLRHHLSTQTKQSYSIHRIENEFLNINKVNNGQGAALGNKIEKKDPCIDFF